MRKVVPTPRCPRLRVRNLVRSSRRRLVHAEAWGRRGGKMIHDTVEAFFECGGAEIDEQTDRQIEQT